MINLFVNYYQPKDEERQKEIDFCLRKNTDNPLINRIIFFANPDGQKLMEAMNKGTFIGIDRPTYQDYFDVAKDYPNNINIIANSDIFFDETLEHVKGIKDNEVYCLTRWEWNDGNIIDFNRMHGAPPRHSQDAWIFKGTPKRMRDCSMVWAVDQQKNICKQIPFTGGIPGNDNHLAYLFHNAGYSVRNPSLTIKAIHVHKERERDYGHKYRITGIDTNGGMKWGQLRPVEQTTL